jgi:hypothetical protein
MGDIRIGTQGRVAAVGLERPHRNDRGRTLLNGLRELRPSHLLDAHGTPHLSHPTPPQPSPRPQAGRAGPPAWSQRS